MSGVDSLTAMMWFGVVYEFCFKQPASSGIWWLVMFRRWMPLTMLVEAQQVKGGEHGEERRFGGLEVLGAKVIAGQIILQLFDALFDGGPPHCSLATWPILRISVLKRGAKKTCTTTTFAS
jgi:hypothetical protein